MKSAFYYTNPKQKKYIKPLNLFLNNIIIYFAQNDHNYYYICAYDFPYDFPMIFQSWKYRPTALIYGFTEKQTREFWRSTGVLFREAVNQKPGSGDPRME